MAKVKTRKENAVAFGWTAPVVTDRINQLQVAASKHKNREKPLFGGEPLVLPKSPANHRTWGRAHSWSTEHDPNLKWRNIHSWTYETDDSSASRSSLAPSLHDENKPFDPFRLGIVESTDEPSETIDKKIDAYLQKAALYEESRTQRMEKQKASENGRTSRRGTSPTPGWLSSHETTRSHSVSFDLTDSEAEILQMHQQKKKQRNNLLEKKINAKKNGRPESTNNEKDDPSISSESSRDKADEEDFFDSLVAKSSSSSHGATKWFESLLDDRPPSKTNESPPLSTKADGNVRNSNEGQLTKVFKNNTSDMSKRWKSTERTRRNASKSNTIATAGSNCRVDRDNSFALETVYSTESDDRATQIMQSPNWRSHGRSRTDHLLRSIEMGSGREKGVYDAFGMKKDPEAHTISIDQREPEGILGNQLSASASSHESGGSNDGLRSTLLVKEGSKSKSFYDRTSLIDFDLSLSTTGSTSSQSHDATLQQDDTQANRPRQNQRRNMRMKKNLSDDESSVFSNLPSGSTTQSFQTKESSCECLPKAAVRDPRPPEIEQEYDDSCTFFSGTESDAALLEGHRPVNLVPKKADPLTRGKSRIMKRPMLSGTKKCREVSSYTNKGIQSIDQCSTSDSDSSGQARAFWRSLANLKTLGSFDSDSFVKATSGRPNKRTSRPLIDQDTFDTGGKDSKDLTSRLLSLKQAPQVSEPRSSQSGAIKLAKRQERRTSMQQSTSKSQPQRQLAAWMSPISEQNTDKEADGCDQNRPEMSKEVEDSVMYLMGPLMSADTEEEEDVTTIATDEFTRPDDNMSVAAHHQPCYSCNDFSFSHLLGWFSF